MKHLILSMSVAVFAIAATAGFSNVALTQTTAPALGDWHTTTTVLTSKFNDVMDTDTELTVIVATDKKEIGDKALKAARETLQGVEAKMSSHLADTDIGRFNAAKVGEEVPMSAETIQVLKIAGEYTKATDGVFDVTCRPILQLWKRAGEAKRLPTESEIKLAVSQVGWDKIKLTDKGATKLKEGVSLDLGGIAKKWAIDRASEAMMKEKIIGGIVNVGGDLRLSGQRQGGGKWQVGIKNPFDKEGSLVATMAVDGGAICTSGNYERFVTIDGKRYSHIVDPRTAKTADSVPSVTVYGKTAVESGIWATALSVTGPDGMGLMAKDHGLEVMIIDGTANNYHFHYSDNFKKMLNEVPEEPLPPTTEPTTTAVPAGS